MRLLTAVLLLLIVALVCYIFFRVRTHTIHPNGITVKDVSPDVPEFKREYQVDIDGRRLKVTIRNFGGALGLYRTGELTQWNGKWILFDPDNVADKIIDPELVPLIEQRCREIDQLDAAFRNSTPSEFTDTGGTTWRRVQK